MHFFTSLLTCPFFLPRERKREEKARERERKEEEVVVIHSFLLLCERVFAHHHHRRCTREKRRRRKISQYNNYYSLSVSLSYPIHTIELILSLFFSWLVVVVQFIYKFISTRIDKKTYTFFCMLNFNLT